MSSPVVNPMMVDTVCSHYMWVKSQLLLINPNQKFGGLVDAKDWPPKDIQPDTLYLAILRDDPTRTKQSFYQPMLTETVEWRFVSQGTNIAPTTIGANRADKFRKTVSLIQALYSAVNPGYCEKLQFSVTPDPTTNEPVSNNQSYNPPDYLWWSIPEFMRKQDRTSGMLYTAGRIQVTSHIPVAQNA